MECPSCHAETLDAGKFCIACGVGLPMPCQSCGASNPAGAKFCAECGHKLAPSRKGSSLAAASDPPSHQAAERRQLTVMFCDLIGSTALSAGLDSEDLRSIITALAGARRRHRRGPVRGVARKPPRRSLAGTRRLISSCVDGSKPSAARGVLCSYLANQQ